MMRALFIALLCIAGTADAATLGVSAPASVTVGDIVTARILVDSAGVAINNAEATLIFPTDILSVISVSKANSVFSLWVEEPSFSNAGGMVGFNGGVPNPGFTGSSGTILSVTFQAKKSGNATLSLSNAAVRANDGKGTNVFTGAGSASLSVSAAVQQAPAPQPTPTPKPVETKPVVGPLPEEVEETPAREEPQPEPSAEEPQTFARVGSVSISFMQAFVAMFCMTLLSLLFALASWLRLYRYRREARIPLSKVRKDMHRGFDLYRGELAKEIRELDGVRKKRDLTREEAVLYKRLVANLADLEKFLNKELDRLE